MHEPSGTQGRTAAEADAAAVVAAYLDAFATGDADAVVRHVADDFVNAHASALGDGCAGRAEYRRRLPGFLTAFPGLHYEQVETLVEGDLVAVRYVLRASHDGHPVEIPGVMWCRVRHDQSGPTLASRVDTWDSLTFLRQTEQA